MTDQRIKNDGGSDKYFSMILHMADDDLGPYEYRLLGHYVRVCGSGGECWESTRTTAEKTKMSVGMVSKARKELERLGYIKVAENSQHKTMTIIVVDRMAENSSRYGSKPAECSPHEQSVHHMNKSVHQVKQRKTIEEKPKKNHYHQNSESQKAQEPLVVVVEGFLEVVKVYEQEIGGLTAMVSEEIKTTLGEYPVSEIVECIRIAVRQNNRRWAYVLGTLKRRKVEGVGKVIPMRQNDLGPAPLNYDPDCGCDHGEILINNSVGDLVSSRCPACAAKFDQKAAS